MKPEEINKKANEAYPIIKRDVGGGKYVPIDNYKKERSGYVKALEEISALPTIKGWVARSKSGELALYHSRPSREDNSWDYLYQMTRLYKTLFPTLRWEDEPIEVELPIIRK